MFDVVIDIKAKSLYVCLKVRQYCLCALWPGKMLITLLSYIYHIQMYSKTCLKQLPYRRP